MATRIAIALCVRIASVSGITDGDGRSWGGTSHLDLYNQVGKFTQSLQKLSYYRCLGSDGYRRLSGPVCSNRPVRQDYLDQFVWTEIVRLLEDPGLVQTEIDRRREVARNADPLRKREEDLRREQARVEKISERLVTAYKEGLVTLPQLRQKMPAL
jgi:site-specific DNA recombinase